MACLAEIQSPKPGNVGRGRDLPGLTYRDFMLSAEALAATFRRHGRARVGRLALLTIHATRRVVNTNTNLGIVLLFAPIARAALDPGPGTLRVRLRRVLRDLDLADARDVYAAIRLARPGGLGRAPEQDVRRPPTAPLLDCMRLAASRDLVAREYATGFSTTFGTGLPAIRSLRRRGLPLRDAVTGAYLTLLAASTDTLVARRHGAAVARRVSRAATTVLRAGGPATTAGLRLMARLDTRLRRARPPVNPGATADLAAASLFVWFLRAGGG
jgi:triphosphoribosyl-dephospho-CoA synthase